jgi:hypothetical protein
MNEQQIQRQNLVDPEEKRKTWLIVLVIIFLIAGSYLVGLILYKSLNKKVEDAIAEGALQKELAETCSDIELDLLSITEISGRQYSLTLINNGQGNVGVKIVLSNTATGSTSESLDFGSFISVSETKTSTLDLGEDVTGVNKVVMNPYLLSEGEEIICPGRITINF